MGDGALREELSVPHAGNCCSRKRIQLVCQVSCCYDAAEGTVPPVVPTPAGLGAGRSGKACVWGKPPSGAPGARNIDGLLQPSSFSHFKGPSGDILPEQQGGGGVSRVRQNNITSKGKHVPSPLVFQFRSLSYLYVWQNIALK